MLFLELSCTDFCCEPGSFHPARKARGSYKMHKCSIVNGLLGGSSAEEFFGYIVDDKQNKSQ